MDEASGTLTLLAYDGAMTQPSVAISGLPPAEVSISADLVQDLIRTQAPRWADEKISFVATGWDNEVYRLGDDLIIRLPRRGLGDSIGYSERKWLPKLAAETGLDITTEIFHGTPTATYPFTFSVTRYVPGQSAATVERNVRDNYVVQLADFFSKLHRTASASSPVSSYRGCALSALDEKTHDQISLLPFKQQAPASLIWKDAVNAPEYSGQPVWLHGDPHPHNTIGQFVQGQFQLSSLVDFGDLCTGDPASDLGMTWLHFSPEGIWEFMTAYGVQEHSDLWFRARGWALRFAMLTAQMPAGDPLGVVGRETLELLLDY